MDIRAYLKEPVELLPGQRALIPTGIYLEIPEGYEVQIRARSGLAIKRGIGLVNGIGTIDSDYRGKVDRPDQLGRRTFCDQQWRACGADGGSAL